VGQVRQGVSVTFQVALAVLYQGVEVGGEVAELGGIMPGE